jgi:hypothetical protein
MCMSSNESSESNSNASSMMASSVRFLFVAILLNALWCNFAHDQTQHLLTDRVSRVCTAGPVACYCSDREGTELSWKDISMNLQFKKVTNKSLLHNKGHLPLIPYWTKQRNKHLYAVLFSPTACTCTHLPQHPDKPALPRHLNIMRLKPKLHK